jgi:hypothetical protein
MTVDLFLAIVTAVSVRWLVLGVCEFWAKHHLSKETT